MIAANCPAIAVQRSTISVRNRSGDQQLAAGFDHAGQQFGCFNHGRIDGLVVASGTNHPATIGEMTPAAWQISRVEAAA